MTKSKKSSTASLSGIATTLQSERQSTIDLDPHWTECSIVAGKTGFQRKHLLEALSTEFMSGKTDDEIIKSINDRRRDLETSIGYFERHLGFMKPTVDLATQFLEEYERSKKAASNADSASEV